MNAASLRTQLAVATLALALCIVLPRALALDRFVTADEHAWLARSGNFYQALAHGDLANTFQRHHPGVTVTWAGLGGFLLTYPRYAWDAPGQFGWLTEEIEPFLRSQGHDPVDVLAAGRGVMVVLITLALVMVFRLSVYLFDFWPAVVGAGLIAFTPFHVAHSRLLHLDGLVSSLMLLSVVAWLLYLVGLHLPGILRLTGGAQSPMRYAILSGVAAGLAWLTRSPALFLGPLVLVLTGLAVWWLPAPGGRRPWNALARGLLVWGGVAALVFVLLWPAMWVDPLGSLRQVLDAAEEYAAEGHLKPIFFAGQIFAGDPGLNFYPVTYLWRSSPVTWIGLALALGAFVLRRPPLDGPRGRFAAAALVIYALGFMLFMDLGAKKFDRYLLPSYLPLELVAGAGWGAALLWAAARGMARPQRNPRGTLRFLPPTAVAIIAAQAAVALPTYPYYLSYYNSLMGGSARAPEVMMIGWGEVADQAGRYLDAKPNAADLAVASGYTNGPFSYFFSGRTLPITLWHEADYAVVYAQDRQRQLPSRKAAAYFAQLTPEQVIAVDGLDYAHIYDLRDAPLPDYVTDWDGAIRLVTFQLPAAVITPGETVRAVFYWLNRAPIDANLNVLVRVVGADGREIARDEGWPWGAATSGWQVGEVWPDGHDLTIPADTPPGHYRIDVGFYDPATQELLPAVQAASGAALGDLVTVDTIQVGELPPPARPLQPPAALGDTILLLGADWQRADGAAFDPARERVAPGETVTARLVWEAQQTPDVDYTAFAHLVGPDGQLAAQHDKPPLDGFLPTRTWYPGQRIADTFTLSVPADAAPGAYRLLTGMYDPATATRLPVRLGEEAQGDAYPLATLQVAP